MLFILLFPCCATAQLHLAKIFSDNMVLQRDEPVHVWGSAAPGMPVQAFFAGVNKTVYAKPDSSWDIYFNEQAASKQPQSMKIMAGHAIIELKNLFIGDIWLCIGQSNMEFPLQQEMHYKDELRQTYQPLLRFYNPSFIGKNVFGKPYTDSMVHQLNAAGFYTGQWQTCDSNTAKTMSAIGYYFGKRISIAEGVPVGLIHLAIGGCPLETFISREALANDKQFAVKLSGNWLNNDAIPVWVKQRAKENIGAHENTFAGEQGPTHAYKPGFAYSAGIEPILSLPVKGILWYQGESNAQEPDRVNEYAALQKLMIADYRAKWKMPAMPFYWVQLSSIDTAGYASQLWPLFRDEQRKLLNEVRNGGMAVCSDLGCRNNVHPTNKKEVAERLARWALNKTYHRSIVPSGPLPLRAVYKNGTIIVAFRYAAGLQTASGKLLIGFSIDGKTDAKAVIKNNQVVIAVKEKPGFVYYAWKPFTDANLVNAEKLPTSTFKIKVQ